MDRKEKPCKKGVCSVAFNSMIRLSTEDFRSTMGGCLDRILLGECFVITRNGTPFVKISPVPSYIDLDNTTQKKAKDVRTKAAEFLGSVHFTGDSLLITRRGKPTALATSLRTIDPGENL